MLLGAVTACGGTTVFSGSQAMAVMGTPPPPAPKPSPPPPPPPPPPPTPVAPAHIEQGKIVIDEKIQFALGSAVILPASDGILTAVANVFKQNPNLKKVEIQGHASADGPADYNMQLSDQRAHSVMAWLVAHGVPQDVLTAKGYGITKPIADNNTEEGREKNRRVEFVILDPPQ